MSRTSLISVIAWLVATIVNAAPAAPTTPVYRFWSEDLGTHFFTASNAEADAVMLHLQELVEFQGAGWLAYARQAPGTVPVYRFRRQDQLRFYYSTEASPPDAASADGPAWRYEGVAWYSAPALGVGLDAYQFWNADLDAYFYTVFPDEIAEIFAEMPEWQFQFVAWDAPDWDQPSSQILSFTDLHFNPFADPELLQDLAELPAASWDEFLARRASKDLSTYGKDANYALFDSLLENARAKIPNPDFILFSGDFLAHHFNQNYDAAFPSAGPAERDAFILKTVQFIAEKVAKAFPEVSVYFTLGNNDAFAGDYAIVDRGPFLAETAGPLFDTWIQTDSSRAEFFATYPQHGWYSIPLAELPQTRLLVLNSIFFSPRHPGEDVTETSAEQLDWLEIELAEASERGERIWLLTHIPPSVDVFATLHQSPPEVVMQWREPALERFVELMRTYEDTILYAQAGHTHMDDFRVVYTAAEPYTALDAFNITMSVSPIFGNNAGFQVYTYDDASAQITGIQSYFLDLKQPGAWPWWQHEYDFATRYGLPPTVAGYDRLFREIPLQQSVRDDYIRFYSVSVAPPAIETAWPAYWCGIAGLTKSDYRMLCPQVAPEQQTR
jgi:hypothetical protein